jgi:hypothetical protein
MTYLLALIGATVGFVGLIAGSAILKGFVLTILWGWFVVPIFHLPQLTIAPAIGIALVIGYLTKEQQSSTDSTKSAGDKFGEAAVYAIVHPLIVLLFGWAVHLFM